MIRVFVAVAVVLLPIALIHLGSHAQDYWQHGFRWSRWDVAAGRQIFESKCARCHSVSGSNSLVGPNLSEVGRNAASRRPNMAPAEYLLESVLRPAAFKAPGSAGEMPMHLVRKLDDDSIRGLVAFLWGLSGQVDDDALSALKIEHPPIPADMTGVDSAAVLRGEAVFRGKGGCVKCHPFYGVVNSDVSAPRLFGRGMRDSVDLRKSILEPQLAVAEQYRLSTIILADGRTLVGRILSRNNVSMTVLTYEEDPPRIRQIATVDLETEENEEPMIMSQQVSSMPTGFATLLTPDELDDLIAFLTAAN